MDTEQRSLIEDVKHKQGRYGGFCFGGQQPDGVVARNPLPAGTVYPNGARAALLLTYDVEGTYGNGEGDMQREIDNYARICERLVANGIPATFNVVGKMAEEHGPAFVEQMWEAGCEVAPHGYVHEMNSRYGGEDVYAGHYGPEQNSEQVRDGVAAIEAIRPGSVRGFRLPYGHFNEYSYDAIADAGLVWSSHVGIEDFSTPGNGYGPMPFQMQLGEHVYPLVEIPIDSQTYDWCIWMADQKTNASFVDSVRRYCELRSIPFERTPKGGVAVWHQRMLDAIESETCFTFICHPINLAVLDERWGDPVDDFMLPVIDLAGELHREGKAWLCTCEQLAEVYWREMGRE